jgi:hypothetical protein
VVQGKGAEELGGSQRTQRARSCHVAAVGTASRVIEASGRSSDSGEKSPKHTVKNVIRKKGGVCDRVTCSILSDMLNPIPGNVHRLVTSRKVL